MPPPGVSSFQAKGFQILLSNYYQADVKAPICLYLFPIASHLVSLFCTPNGPCCSCTALELTFIVTVWGSDNDRGCTVGMHRSCSLHQHRRTGKVECRLSASCAPVSFLSVRYLTMMEKHCLKL